VEIYGVYASLIMRSLLSHAWEKEKEKKPPRSQINQILNAFCDVQQ